LGFNDIPPHLPLIVPPVLDCFIDMDAKVRYFACESMYNVAKVAKGEILVYFNELFDAMAKVRCLAFNWRSSLLSSSRLTRNYQSKMAPSCWTALSRTS
jgi:hypothetical protein